MSTKINFYKYNCNIFLKKNIKNIKIYNNLLVCQEIINDCDTLIYYWPKNKCEAEFQLINIISSLPIKAAIFIVGENSSGVKSASLMLKNWITLNKIDSAKHSILVSGVLKIRKHFFLEKYFKTHKWNKFFIKSLPGVFGHKKIDEGSKLLASTFSNRINGKVLDVGSGTGFLSVALLYSSPDVILTLVDNNMAALKCSQFTLDFNKLKGEVICSDLYSNIFEKFNLIISNPPFHNNLKNNFNIIKEIIFNSKKYLKFDGELRFVINSCFNYDFLLKKTFKKYFILKKTSKFKVYQAFLN